MGSAETALCDRVIDSHTELAPEAQRYRHPASLMIDGLTAERFGSQRHTS